MNAPSAKVLGLEELQAVRERLRSEGKVVVQCHGCFDIVHPGHIRYLRFAREQGDALVVSVSADEVVGKGADRPYIHEELRLENLAALEFVDYVCLDHGTWAGPVLEALRPDIYVKGKEYEGNADPRFAREKELVEGYGGKVIYSSGEVVYSSTFILSQFRDRFRFERERAASFCRRHRLSRAGLREAVGRFTRLHVVVLGDPVLDRYIHCDALSVAAESPILSVSPIKEEWFLGAAALIARQCVHFGARATFLSAMGESPESERFLGALRADGVEVETVGEDDRPVYVKTRYLVDESKVFKVSSGRHAPLSTVASRELLHRIEELVPGAEGLIVTDFGYGLCSREIVDGVGEVRQRTGKPYFVDVSSRGAASILAFQGPRLATPTEEELRFAFADRESGLSNLASRYYRATGAEQLVITLGKRGAVLFDPPAEEHARLNSDYLPALGQNPIDTVGAGDVMLASMALMTLAGASAAAGLYVGSCAAALHVARLGNDPVALADLVEYLEQAPDLTD